MDYTKIGNLISQLRKEKNFTQKNIADALHISNKTVSKWECGLGCPDISILPELSVILGVDMAQILEGEIQINEPDIGKLEKINFYVCPTCSNVMTATGSASVFCCGRKLEPLMPAEDQLVSPEDYPSKPQIKIDQVDVDYYITIDHEMTRDNYILFAAYVLNERVTLIRMYPQQTPEVRISHNPGGRLYIYSTMHGIFSYQL